MKCWHCNDELIWGGDHDCDEDNEEYVIETNLSCPTCGSLVMVYYPREKEEIKTTNKTTKIKRDADTVQVEFYEDDTLIGAVDYSNKSIHYVESAIENFHSGVLTTETIDKYSV